MASNKYNTEKLKIHNKYIKEINVKKLRNLKGEYLIENIKKKYPKKKNYIME